MSSSSVPGPTLADAWSPFVGADSQLPLLIDLIPIPAFPRLFALVTLDPVPDWRYPDLDGAFPNNRLISFPAPFFRSVAPAPRSGGGVCGAVTRWRSHTISRDSCHAPSRDCSSSGTSLAAP